MLFSTTFCDAKRNNLEIVVVDDDAVEDNKKKELGKTLLPVFFRIADYAEKLKQQSELTLLEYLHQFYRQWEVHFQAQGEIETEVVALLLDAMRQGKCLMLLNGLDEVFDQQSRKQIVERINSYLAPLRTISGNLKTSTIKLPSFYQLLSLNQGLWLNTE